MESRKKTYYETLSGEVKDRYDKKISKCGGVDPYTIKTSDLSLNPKDLPKISSDDIENYMVHCVSPFTKRSYNNFKGTEAHSFFESGFVLSLGSKKHDDLAIVKGKVSFELTFNIFSEIMLSLKWKTSKISYIYSFKSRFHRRKSIVSWSLKFATSF